MATEQNPTGSDAGASTPSDPIDRIEAFLSAQDGGDSNGQAEQSDDPNKAQTTDDPKDGAQEKDEGPQFTTTHLAQHLGLDESAIDVDEEGQPVFKTKIDGKESPVKFQDLLKSYQLQGHAENRVREAAARETAAQARLQEAEQAIQGRYQQAEMQMQQLAELAQIQQQDLNHDYNSIDWNKLWQTDPGQAGILQGQFQQKNARIQQALQNIGQRRQQAQQQAVQQHQVNAQRALQAEAQRLREVIPEWADRAVAAKEQGELTEWAMNRGYDPGYIDALHNARVPNAAVVIRDLRAAWKHDTLVKSRPATENKVKTAPKLVKPGQAPTNDGKATTLKSLKQQIRNSTGNGGRAATAEYLIARGLA